jgi:hypothetical protein
MQKQRYLIALGLFSMLVGGILTLPARSHATTSLFEPLPAVMQQAPTPFLLPPYYETEQANCVFDHEYPVYSSESTITTTASVATTVVHHDGTRWTGTLSSCNLGTPSCYSGHAGIDYSTRYERILASANGIVRHAGWVKPQSHGYGLGLMVRIEHNNNNGYQTVYGHLSAVAVESGTQITDAADGRVIGISGDTGYSDGPHLHFQVEPPGDSRRVNPYGWIGSYNDPWEQYSGLTSHDLWSNHPSISNTDVYSSGTAISAPPDPDPTAPGVVLVDESSGFTENPPNCWTQATGGYSDTLRFTSTFTTTTSPGYSACAGTWSLPSLPGRAGEFNVYAYVPASHATADGAIYTIHHQGQNHQAVVAQAEFLKGATTDIRHWAYLGKYTFDLNGTESIQLTNVTDDEINGLDLAADAVMLVPTSTTLNGDVVVSGIGLRGSGTGNITVSGIPSGATVHEARLYWGTIGSHDTFTSPSLNGQSVNGVLIGTLGDTNWGAAHNFVYRADVTSIVTGNGTYTLSGLPGSSPTSDDSQGASLIVIYEHSSSPLRTVIINDVAVVMNSCDAHTDTITGFSTGDPLTEAQVTYIVGDGQTSWDDGDVTFNNSVIATNAFVGSDGDYWDTLTYDVTALSPPDPSTTTVDTLGAPNPCDYLVWVATVFVSSSDTSIPTPTPTPLPTSTSSPTPTPTPTSTPTPPPANTPTPTPSGDPTPTPTAGCRFEASSSAADAKAATTGWNRAVAAARHLTDLTEMADLLYRIRDELLDETSAGQHYIDVYYTHSAEIAGLMLTDPELDDMGLATLDLFVAGLEALLDGHGDTVTITADQVTQAQAFLDALSAAGSPALQQAIAEERARRPLVQMVGMTFDEAWTYLNGYTLTWTWLPPVSVTDPYTAQVGSTIPVQFTLTDLEGSFVTDESVTLQLLDADGNVVVGPIGLAESPSRGIVIRGHKYHYNLRTKGLPPGTYTLAVSYNSITPGLPATVTIVLKGK